MFPGLDLKGIPASGSYVPGPQHGPRVFRTHTGRVIDILRPTPGDIDLTDIVMALARVQRFGGQAHSEFASVAEHSVLVSRLCLPRNAVLGLFHDGSEGIIGDVVTPLKCNLSDYKQIERRWQSAIGRAIGVGDALVDLPSDVHAADAIALQTERRDWFTDNRVDPDGPEPTPYYQVTGLRPKDAALLFYERLKELTP